MTADRRAPEARRWRPRAAPCRGQHRQRPGPTCTSTTVPALFPDAAVVPCSGAASSTAIQRTYTAMPSTTAITASTASGHSPAASKGTNGTTLATRPRIAGGSPARVSNARISGHQHGVGPRQPLGMPQGGRAPILAPLRRAHSGRDGEGDEAGRGIRQGRRRRQLGGRPSWGQRVEHHPAGLGDRRPREKADEVGRAEGDDRADEHRPDREGADDEGEGVRVGGVGRPAKGR